MIFVILAAILTLVFWIDFGFVTVTVTGFSAPFDPPKLLPYDCHNERAQGNPNENVVPRAKKWNESNHIATLEMSDSVCVARRPSCSLPTSILARYP